MKNTFKPRKNCYEPQSSFHPLLNKPKLSNKGKEFKIFIPNTQPDINRLCKELEMIYDLVEDSQSNTKNKSKDTLERRKAMINQEIA